MFSSEYHNFMYFFGAEVGFALLILFIKINVGAFILKAGNITCSKLITC
jgi:hypothetical protein